MYQVSDVSDCTLYSALPVTRFLNFFLLLLVIFALLDPDSEAGSGSTDLIETGSSPGPKPWFFVGVLKVNVKNSRIRIQIRIH
jgi:hypothetical protein